MSPSQFTSVIGDASVQIRCDITGSPPAITWYWIKIPFTSGYSTIIYQGTNNQHYTVEGSSTGPHLTIKDITVNDQADYMCVAVSVTGTTLSLKSRLYVEGGRFIYLCLRRLTSTRRGIHCFSLIYVSFTFGFHSIIVVYHFQMFDIFTYCYRSK